jgi:hypothetical protein
MWKNISRSGTRDDEGAYNGVRNANFHIDVQFELRCISFQLGNHLL